MHDGAEREFRSGLEDAGVCRIQGRRRCDGLRGTGRDRSPLRTVELTPSACYPPEGRGTPPGSRGWLPLWGIELGLGLLPLLDQFGPPIKCGAYFLPATLSTSEPCIAAARASSILFGALVVTTAPSSAAAALDNSL
ncbi:hypothetical protein CRENBAI_015786 [Crenichthys baileyi]|uniref:Uncharacterized protein n=1 Tax=Crenichthys baileyi TaxID=28760 RepID=A0AAV9RJE6_9TELE